MRKKALFPFMVALTTLVLLGCPNPSTPPTDTVINLLAIPGVTSPVTGAPPATVITETSQYTGTVTWNGSPTTFAASTVYTAIITLTAKAGFTFTGVGENSFTVTGATATNPVNSGVVTAVFPATEVAPLIKAIHLGGNWGYNFNNITNSDPSYYPDDFIEFLQDLNVEWVGLSVSLHVDHSLDSTVELEYSGNIPTFTDVALSETLTWLRDNGFRTYVTLAFELEDPATMEYPVSRWQLGDPNMPYEDQNVLAENWPWALDHPDHEQFINSFFSSYAESAAHVAKICEEQGVEMFSIGTETERLFRTRSGNGWENSYLDGLIEITNSVREVYGGLVTYDMSYDALVAQDFYGTGSDYLWQDLDLDVVGISAYFQLSEESPLELLNEEFFLNSWQDIFDDYLIPLKIRNPDLPILFLEFGYTNAVESPYRPNASEFSDYVFFDSNNNSFDDGEEVQANIYSAFFRILNENAGIVEGAFLWGNEIMDINQQLGDWNQRVHFGIREKLVQYVVSSNYSVDH